MRKWIKIAVPLGIAGVLLAALAIGFPSPSSNAAECGDSASFSGSVSSGSEANHTIRFCSDPDADFGAALNWRNAKKDLRLVITDPEGTVYVMDRHVQQSYEVAVIPGPLPEGDWTISVEYDGKGKVSYSLWAGFH
jgi:hypothetical protein